MCVCVCAGSSTIPVSGIKGGIVTLSCGSEDREIVAISLFSVSKHIPVCEERNCSGRVCKEGSCDVIINGLIYSDAGKYFLHVYYTNDQRKLEQLMLEYQLHIHGKVKTDQTSACVWSSNIDTLSYNDECVCVCPQMRSQ